jgi:ATP-dependent DNA helicase RecG
MDFKDLVNIINKGEDSKQQFKKNVTHHDSLTADFVAFSNGMGGRILIGVDDNSQITGLSVEDIRRINQYISNISSQNVHPPINPITENIKTPNGLVMVVSVASGCNKPYQDKNGTFWVKCGADKRKATSREEIQRMFQEADFIHADETPVNDTSISDVDVDFFRKYYFVRYEEELLLYDQTLENMFENMNLIKGKLLTVSGALLFSKKPEIKLPMYIVKAVAFNSNDITDNDYNDSQDITGRLDDVFKSTVNFIISNIHHVQCDQDFNSLGKPEIPKEVIKELIANALLHRNYFISATIRVLVFRNRVEIISPGHLPNNLTVENIKAGNSKIRNPLLVSFANLIVPYRGIGSGIKRAMKLYPNIEFIDDRDGNQFTVILHRKNHLTENRVR